MTTISSKGLEQFSPSITPIGHFPILLTEATGAKLLPQ